MYNASLPRLGEFFLLHAYVEASRRRVFSAIFDFKVPVHSLSFVVHWLTEHVSATRRDCRRLQGVVLFLRAAVVVDAESIFSRLEDFSRVCDEIFNIG